MSSLATNTHGASEGNDGDVNDTELGCVVIPVDGTQLLLPNVCVAEILPWRRIKPGADEPAWCMGFTSWRGQVLPVLNYAGFANPTQRTLTARCLVVMNRSQKADGQAFYALAGETLPRMVQLVGEDLTPKKDALGPADALHVSLGSEAAVVPNLEFIEGAVAKLIADKLAKS